MPAWKLGYGVLSLLSLLPETACAQLGRPSTPPTRGSFRPSAPEHFTRTVPLPATATGRSQSTDSILEYLGAGAMIAVIGLAMYGASARKSREPARGIDPAPKPALCWSCGGEGVGWVWLANRSGKVQRPCADCKGLGRKPPR